MSKPWKSKPCQCCGCANWHHDYLFFTAAFVSGCAGCDGCAGYEPDKSADDLICDSEFQAQAIDDANDRRDRFVAEHPKVLESLKQYVEEHGLTDKLNQMIAEMEAEDE